MERTFHRNFGMINILIAINKLQVLWINNTSTCTCDERDGFLRIPALRNLSLDIANNYYSNEITRKMQCVA